MTSSLRQSYLKQISLQPTFVAGAMGQVETLNTGQRGADHQCRVECAVEKAKSNMEARKMSGNEISEPKQFKLAIPGLVDLWFETEKNREQFALGYEAGHRNLRAENAECSKDEDFYYSRGWAFAWKAFTFCQKRNIPHFWRMNFCTWRGRQWDNNYSKRLFSEGGHYAT